MILDNDLNDDLSDLIGVKTAARPVTPPATYTPPTYTEKCPRCGGSGRYGNFGTCFKCKGSGKQTFKTSHDDRARGRQQAAQRKANREQEKLDAAAAWTDAHKAETAWLAAAANRNSQRGGNFDFPQKLLDVIANYGGLSENQLAAVRRLMVRDDERTEARKLAAKDVDVSKIEKAFATAKAQATRPGQKGLWTKPLHLRKGDKKDPSAIDLTFRPGSDGSQWEGMIFVKAGEKKLGHVQGGKFIRKFHCTDVEAEAVVEVCQDPLQAAEAYAKAWSRCGICNRTLLNDDSIARGIGPICASRYGWA